MSAYKNIEVYKKSYNIAIQIHKHFTNKNLDKKYAYDLVDQVLRSSRSIPANIAEGYGRKEFQKELARFLWTAVGSKDETIVHLDFLKDLNYMDSKTHLEFTTELENIGKMLYGFIKKINENIKS